MWSLGQEAACRSGMEITQSNFTASCCWRAASEVPEGLPLDVQAARGTGTQTACYPGGARMGPQEDPGIFGMEEGEVSPHPT